MSEDKKYEFIIVENVEEGNYAVISLNRPDKLNALHNPLLKEVVDALESMEMDPTVRCVVLRGTKDFTKKASFSSGADLAAPMGKGIKPNIPSHMQHAMYTKHKYYDLIEEFNKPLIAAVDGYAFGGGCELSLVCDIVIATKRSVFGFPEIVRGIFPANGGTQRMSRRIGLNRALKMLYFGERESAETMYEWGYVSFLTSEGDEFESLVHEKASWLGHAPTTALMIIKKSAKFGTQVPLKIGLIMEQMGFGINSGSSDVMEGINAFLTRKEPKFTGGL